MQNFFWRTLKWLFFFQKIIKIVQCLGASPPSGIFRRSVTHFPDILNRKFYRLIVVPITWASKISVCCRFGVWNAAIFVLLIKNSIFQNWSSNSRNNRREVFPLYRAHNRPPSQHNHQFRSHRGKLITCITFRPSWTPLGDIFAFRVSWSDASLSSRYE